MCRALAYLGQPVLLDTLLFQPDSALIRQSYMPKMLHMLNLAGFGERMRGAGPRYDAIAQLFALQCRRLGLATERLAGIHEGPRAPEVPKQRELF